MEGKKFKSNFSSKSIEVTGHLTCEEKNCIYLIQCKTCDQQYIGECKSFYKRMLQHLCDGRTDKRNAIRENLIH